MPLPLAALIPGAVRLVASLGSMLAYDLLAKKYGPKVGAALTAAATKAGGAAGKNVVGKTVTKGLQGSVKKIPGRVGGWMPGTTNELVTRGIGGMGKAAAFAAPMVAMGVPELFMGDSDGHDMDAGQMMALYGRMMGQTTAPGLTDQQAIARMLERMDLDGGVV